MSLSTEALAVLLVLLPGFVCAKIVQWLCPRPQQTEMERVVDALVYSAVVYLIFLLIFGLPAALTRKRAAVLLIIPVVLAFLISYLMTNDSIGSVLRKCRITHRTTRPSLWHDVFHKYESHYVVVELGDGRVALGWVEFYSDFPSAPSLFLNDACWIDRESGERRQIDGPGILISGEIKTISFHTPKDIRRSPDKPDSTADVLGSTARATLIAADPEDLHT
jgi:hypothetical protein